MWWLILAYFEFFLSVWENNVICDRFTAGPFPDSYFVHLLASPGLSCFLCQLAPRPGYCCPPNRSAATPKGILSIARHTPTSLSWPTAGNCRLCSGLEDHCKQDGLSKYNLHVDNWFVCSHAELRGCRAEGLPFTSCKTWWFSSTVWDLGIISTLCGYQLSGITDRHNSNLSSEPGCRENTWSTWVKQLAVTKLSK